MCWRLSGCRSMAYPLFLKLCVFTRQHRGKLLGASSLGLLAVNVSYHAFPEQTFRRLYQGWSKGEPTPLSDKLRALFQDVLDDTRLASTRFSPFAAYGFQPISAGVPWLPSGCLIGIPANYNGTMEDGAGVTDRLLVINGEEVDWASELGRRLRDSLTFSVNAQKFSLAREAIHAQTSGPILQASVAPLCLTSVCVSSVALKQLLGLYSGPILLRGVFNALAILLGFTGYFLCSDAVSQWLDYRSDRRAAAVSKAYARGGLEFYEKILTRNRLLRGIMGEQGGTMYAPSGNVFPKHKLRMKHAPYTSRRDRILRALEKQQD
ncbi:transmembrane protein 177 isoform X1 [Bufo gargarizans]|uniref:transmembrane protein 177 isoform X1 n=2 Tax=Bufo gargarizans TaxID=30331 RepID=UPI001CF1089C|nr:transmembrane protein 177 isoform X1 [Bufo gargarizans]